MSVHKLAEKIRKLEAVLKGHHCTFLEGIMVENAGSLSWDGRRISWNGLPLSDICLGGIKPPTMAVIGAATRLVSKCIMAQEKYETVARDGVEVIDTYLSEAPWFKEELIDPVEGVYPKENA